MWTDGEVAKDKVLASRWMRQFAHTWRHFAFWVPWVRKGRHCDPLSGGQALCPSISAAIELSRQAPVLFY